jgi:hypothetical protein
VCHLETRGEDEKPSCCELEKPLWYDLVRGRSTAAQWIDARTSAAAASDEKSDGGGSIRFTAPIDAARMRVVRGHCMGNGAIYICKVERFRSHKLRLQLGKIWTPTHAALHSTVRISGDGDRSPLNLFLCAHILVAVLSVLMIQIQRRAL